MPEYPTAAFNVVTPMPACEGNPIQFSDNSGGDIIGWEWDFGDASGNLNQNPEKTYATYGTYPVNLTVTDEYGCTNTSANTNLDIRENKLAGSFNTVSSGSLPLCPGDVATIDFTLDPNPLSSPYSFSWNNSSSSSGSSLTSSTTANQTANLFVEVVDTYGCIGNFGPEVVEAVEIPNAFIKGNDSYCVGDIITLVCNYGATYNYDWYVVGNATLQGSGPQLVISGLTAGTYNYEVELSSLGCTKMSAPITFTVHNNPTDPVISSNVVPACPDQPITLTVTNNSLYSSIAWTNGDTGSSTIVQTSGTYYAEGTDANGCSSNSSFDIFELPNFCSFMCGCYTDCIEPQETFYFPGVLGTYNYWAWESYTTGGWSIVDFGSGAVNPLAITTAGIYTVRLYVETLDGCTGYSCETDVTITNCGGEPDPEGCDGFAEPYEIWCETAEDGIAGYRFNFGLNFSSFGTRCRNGFYYTVIPPYGSVSQLQNYPYQFNPGTNSISGYWSTGMHYFPSQQVCFTIVILNDCDLTECIVEVCFDVEPCGEPQEGEDGKLKPEERFEFDIDNQEVANIKFFPNPASSQLFVDLANEGKYFIFLYDIQGKVVFTETISQVGTNAVSLDLSGIPDGTYTIQAIGENQVATERIVIMNQ